MFCLCFHTVSYAQTARHFKSYFPDEPDHPLEFFSIYSKAVHPPDMPEVFIFSLTRSHQVSALCSFIYICHSYNAQVNRHHFHIHQPIQTISIYHSSSFTRLTLCDTNVQQLCIFLPLFKCKPTYYMITLGAV